VLFLADFSRIVPLPVSELTNDLFSYWDYFMTVCRIVYLRIAEKLG